MGHALPAATMLAATAIMVSPASVSAQAAAPAPASAPPPATQDPAAGPIGDIVVTAERRSTSLQRTPIMVSAYTGDQLRSENVTSLPDVQTVTPGLKIGVNAGQAQVTVRGIGTSSIIPASEPAVAVNVNEVYVARQSALTTSMYDLGNLEVLRGPQGTLYGRNATAGSINLTTARPGDTWSGYAQVTVGNYTAVNTEAAIGGPIVADRIGIRVAAFVDRHDGYGRNVVTSDDVDNRDAKGARVTLVLKPVANVKATIIGEVYNERDQSGARHYFGAMYQVPLTGTIPTPPDGQRDGGYVASRLRDISAAYDPQLRLNVKSVTGIVEWGEGPISLKSVSGYRDQKFNYFSTLDGGSTFGAFYVAGEPAHQFSQELQAHYDRGRVHATAGLFYFDEKVSASPSRAPASSDVLYPEFGLPAPASPFLIDFVELSGTIKTRAKAVFGQVDYEPVDRLTFTAGLRYGSETKQLFSTTAVDLTLSKPYLFDPASPFYSTTPPGPLTVLPKRTFNSTTPRVAVRFQATPRIMAYASFSKGFKSGGYDVSTTAPAFNPEKLDAYEAGLKTTVWNGRLRVDLSGFYYNYSDLQVQQLKGLQVVTQNAGRARLYGGEALFTAKPFETFTVDLSATYLHTRYVDFLGASAVRPLLPDNVDFSGNRLNNAPTFAGFLSAEKIWPFGAGQLHLKGEGEYSSRYYFSPDNIDPLSQGKFAKINFYLRYASNHHWTAMLFVKNATDRINKTSANVVASAFGGAIEGSVSPPRTYGVQMGYSF